MRKRFEVQYEIGAKPIEDLEIPTKSRDELPAVLRGLQYIYVTPEINEKVFSILEQEIKISKRGSPGLSLWEILVFGVVRLTLDIDYDRLEHIANYDGLVRDMLGTNTFGMLGKKLKTYPLQTIKDNVRLLSEETIDKISGIVVESGYSIKKKDSGAELDINIKVDSYVLESNVHFPTDYNLLWDASRKCIDLIEIIKGERKIKGWRKYSDWKRRIKNAFISVCRSSMRGGIHRVERLQKSVEKYLSLTEVLLTKIKDTKEEIAKAASESQVKLMRLKDLEYFELMLEKQNNLLKRRVIYGETIEHEEKIFSLFETYTEWINKGKSGNRIELGLRISISTDQYGFIIDRRIMEKEIDVEVAVPIAEKLRNMLGSNIGSISFDKGYWSKENYEELRKIVKEIILPKRGKLNKEEYDREHDKKFKMLRKGHSLIESNINSLEHHGLNRCPDRGIKHFKNYSALGVLAYNLHLLGKIILEEDKKRYRNRFSRAA
jgi:hypothetical protein